MLRRGQSPQLRTTSLFKCKCSARYPGSGSQHNTNPFLSGSVIGNQIYRKWDSPYYKTGNKVCVSILALSLVVFVVHRQYLVHLNNKKEKIWSSMSPEEQLEYQTDKEARQADGNKRLDFRFAY